MNPFKNLPKKRYDVILADPPWDYRGGNGFGLDFETVSNVDMERLRIRDLLNPRGVLFVWTTGPKLDLTVNLIQKQWGLCYRGVAFVWVKTKQNGEIAGAVGPRPSIVKPTAEFVLVASKVKFGRPIPIADESVNQIVLAPRRELCRKPEEVTDRIEALYPKATKLEMFAREFRLGWDRWGDEINKFRIEKNLERNRKKSQTV